MGKPEDWCFDLNGDEVFEGLKMFDFGFGFYFVAVERFVGQYSEDEVAFEGGYFGEVMDFGKIHKCIGDFGSLDS